MHLSNNERGILCLDLDETLFRANSLLGSELWYRFIIAQNNRRGIPSDSHYGWSISVRERITYAACEKSTSALLQEFRNHNWTVIALTSRGGEMREITDRHLREAKLPLSIDDVILTLWNNKECPPKLYKKSESLKHWIKGHIDDSDQSLKILFADDSKYHCEDVITLTKDVELANRISTLFAFHYQDRPSTTELTNQDLTQLVLELQLYEQENPLSPLPEDDALKVPSSEKMEQIVCDFEQRYLIEQNKSRPNQAERVYSIMERIAESKGYPFQPLILLQSAPETLNLDFIQP